MLYKLQTSVCLPCCSCQHSPAIEPLGGGGSHTRLSWSPSKEAQRALHTFCLPEHQIPQCHSTSSLPSWSKTTICQIIFFVSKNRQLRVIWTAYSKTSQGVSYTLKTPPHFERRQLFELQPLLRPSLNFAHLLWIWIYSLIFLGTVKEWSFYVFALRTWSHLCCTQIWLFRRNQQNKMTSFLLPPLNLKCHYVVRMICGPSVEDWKRVYSVCWLKPISFWNHCSVLSLTWTTCINTFEWSHLLTPSHRQVEKSIYPMLCNICLKPQKKHKSQLLSDTCWSIFWSPILMLPSLSQKINPTGYTLSEQNTKILLICNFTDDQ